jgi:hypothetical protein
MPNRVVRDGLLSSRTVASLSDSGQIFFDRLMLVVDDFGRFVADIDILRSKLFPVLLDRWPVERVQDALAECNATYDLDGCPLVVVYSYRKRRYLELQKFNQRLRLKKAKYPSPTAENVTFVRAEPATVAQEASRCDAESTLPVVAQVTADVPQNEQISEVQRKMTVICQQVADACRPESESEEEVLLDQRQNTKPGYCATDVARADPPPPPPIEAIQRVEVPVVASAVPPPESPARASRNPRTKPILESAEIPIPPVMVSPAPAQIAAASEPPAPPGPEAIGRPSAAWFTREHEAWYLHAYWRHVGKQASRKAFERAVIKLMKEQQITAQDAVVFLTEQAHTDRGRFESTDDWSWRQNLHPATWLNQCRWEDEPLTTAVARAKPPGRAAGGGSYSDRPRDFVAQVTRRIANNVARGRSPL